MIDISILSIIINESNYREELGIIILFVIDKRLWIKFLILFYPSVWASVYR